MNHNINIRLLLLSILALIGCGFSANAALTFSGNALPAITETTDASSGLTAIYILDNTAGVTASYTASSASSQVTWMRFSALGGGYAEDIASSRDGNVSSIQLTADDMGYIVEEGTSRQYFWIVNYANHRCSLENLAISSEQDCMTATLLFTGSADKITYYSINGVPRTLSRGLTLEYNTLEYNEERNTYDQKTESTEIEYINSEIHVVAPYCNTEFTLSGDKFQATWGTATSIVSPSYTAMAVEAHTSATQTTREVDNEQKDNDSSGALGGSAPVEISFEAVVTDAAIYHEWQFSSDSEFNDIDLRINTLEYTRQFTEYGTMYVRFVAGDNSGQCEWISETYTVNIGESKLECPNAFSPGTSEGVNDEWKVSYKSIVTFDCHIYNRWGQEVAHLTDPSQGWDGRYKGKLVKSGVFYYVIKAQGSDGRDYKLAGDINIIHATYNNSTTSGE
jgi:gliding motility-associated-like protein